MSDTTTDATATTDQAPKPTPPPAAPNGSEADKSTPEQLPEDHPLVKALAAQKDEIKALKARTARLDEIEDAQKSDAERAAEALANAQAEAAKAHTELLRYRTAAAHGITDAEDIELFLTGTDEDTLERQAKALAARTNANAGPRAPKPDPNQGRTGDRPPTTGELFASAFQGRL